MTDVFENRRLVMKQACESHWALNLGKKLNTWSILYDNPKNMVYCHVAKAGCTTWGRIFSFISRADEMRRLNITSPFEIQRRKVHYGPLLPIGNKNWDNLKPELPTTAKKFMFTRDPYARLWSVYLDKFYLPDFLDYYLSYKMHNLTKCLSNKELVRSMWYVFQANGHIRSSSQFPEDLPDYTEPTVRTVLENLVRGNPITKEESQTQRRSSLVEAYKTVTSAHVRAIQEKFQADFEMFEYDIRPPI
ncbi:carbohydrate sulfotransferase 12-like [Physella acuta]|uniref:carbohydrate sulfotransferase 12-like n=1 Tax=Physella acuta TaxID=109671 RepID=UPI0027DB4014|nr:carbohydrate sulfotransferase 12-like [Physella acuta]